MYIHIIYLSLSVRDLYCKEKDLVCQCVNSTQTVMHYLQSLLHRFPLVGFQGLIDLYGEKQNIASTAVSCFFRLAVPK